MDPLLIPDSHQGQAPWAWRLAPREATTVAPASQPRWLLVSEGRLWLTRSNGAAQADDVWVQAGEGFELPPGTAWIVEAWPRAQFSLALQARPSPARARALSALS